MNTSVWRALRKEKKKCVPCGSVREKSCTVKMVGLLNWGESVHLCRFDIAVVKERFIHLLYVSHCKEKQEDGQNHTR